MAIVLVIIGIILAGVMKGRDIVRGAQVKQFTQQFALKWGTIAQTYYDKTGQYLLDGTQNGGPGGTGYPLDGTMKGWLGACFNASSTKTQKVLQGVGIDPCTLVKSKLQVYMQQYNYGNRTYCNGDTNPVQTLVEGEYTGSVVVPADLRTHDLSLGGQICRRNLIVLFNVPTDVAQGVDTIVDGKVDGTSGSCIGLGAAYAIDGTPPTAYTYIPNSAGVEQVAATAWEPASSALVQTVGIMLDF